LTILDDAIAGEAPAPDPCRMSAEAALLLRVDEELRGLHAEGWRLAGSVDLESAIRGGRLRTDVQGCMLTGLRVTYQSISVRLQRATLAMRPVLAGKRDLPCE
jgi:hypothetical protein